MRIGELAQQTLVSPRSLRYYESLGLLESGRTPGGQREFPERAVDRVVLIQHLFAAGLCSSKIRELLPCLREFDAGPAQGATSSLLEALEEQAERLDEQIRGLQRARAVVEDMLSRSSALRAGGA